MERQQLNQLTNHDIQRINSYLERVERHLRSSSSGEEIQSKIYDLREIIFQQIEAQFDRNQSADIAPIIEQVDRNSTQILHPDPREEVIFSLSLSRLWGGKSTTSSSMTEFSAIDVTLTRFVLFPLLGVFIFVSGNLDFYLYDYLTQMFVYLLVFSLVAHIMVRTLSPTYIKLYTVISAWIIVQSIYWSLEGFEELSFLATEVFLFSYPLVWKLVRHYQNQETLTDSLAKFAFYTLGSTIIGSLLMWSILQYAFEDEFFSIVFIVTVGVVLLIYPSIFRYNSIVNAIFAKSSLVSPTTTQAEESVSSSAEVSSPLLLDEEQLNRHVLIKVDRQQIKSINRYSSRASNLGKVSSTAGALFSYFMWFWNGFDPGLGLTFLLTSGVVALFILDYALWEANRTKRTVLTRMVLREGRTRYGSLIRAPAGIDQHSYEHILARAMLDGSLIISEE